ncbi:MAG: hypothetical protein Q7S63_00390, partial [bacterium]|nr:hypothetical protein [bacterium]
SVQRSEAEKRWYKKYRKGFEKYKREHPEDYLGKIHRNLEPYQYKERYTLADLLGRIKEFYVQQGRIPLKREFGDLRIYRERFGSWNKAIRLAGFEPNKQKFTAKCEANDGHSCDSFAERIIDDWFLANKIPHERHVPYDGTKMTADFVVRNVRIEYFGLARELKEYDEGMERKRILCQKQGLQLLEIYPSDLFSKRRKEVESILRKL